MPILFKRPDKLLNLSKNMKTALFGAILCFLLTDVQAANLTEKEKKTIGF